MPESVPIPPDSLTEAQALEELTRLADDLAAHDIRYYQHDEPTVSDAEYDALKQRNAALEARFPHLVRENSPSLRVGAARAEQFSPVEHGVPMLSLDNAFADDEATEFDARIPGLGNQTVRFKVAHVAVMGDFATWRATDTRQGFDMKSFQMEARPLQPVDGLRVGMSVLVDL